MSKIPVFLKVSREVCKDIYKDIILIAYKYIAPYSFNITVILLFILISFLSGMLIGQNHGKNIARLEKAAEEEYSQNVVRAMFGRVGASWTEAYRGKERLLVNLNLMSLLDQKIEYRDDAKNMPLISQVYLSTVLECAMGRVAPNAFMKRFEEIMSAAENRSQKGINRDEGLIGRGHSLYRWKDSVEFFNREERENKKDIERNTIERNGHSGDYSEGRSEDHSEDYSIGPYDE